MRNGKKLIVCAAVLASLASALVRQATAQEDQRLTVAVFDFTVPTMSKTMVVRDGDTRITVRNVITTDLLTDKFITALARSGRVLVVERARLAHILKEIDLGKAGMTDPNKTIETGKLLGAQLLLFGVLDNLEGEVTQQRIPYTERVRRDVVFRVAATIRLVSTETGRIVAAQSANVTHHVRDIGDSKPSYQNLLDAQERLVTKLTYMVLDEVYPVQVLKQREQDVFINRGANDGVEIGTEFLVVRRYGELTDPDTGMFLGYEEREIAEIKVHRVDPRMSVARVSKWHVEEKQLKEGDTCKRIEREEHQDAGKDEGGAAVERVFR